MTPLSPWERVFFSAWTLAVVVSLAATLWLAVLSRQPSELRSSVAYGLSAVTPMDFYLVEFGYRFLVPGAFPRGLAYHEFTMVVPCAIWLLAGPALFALSFVRWGALRPPLAWQLARVFHVIAFGIGAAATVMTLAYV